MGLLDAFTTDPEQQRALTQGLLAGAFGAMAGRGSRLQAWGQGGLAGIQGYSNSLDRSAQEKQQAAQMQRQALQDQLLKSQLAEAQRQQQIAALPQQFVTPGTLPPTMDNRDVGQPGEQRIPQSFDQQGYLQALMGKDPMAAIQYAQAIRKETPQPVKLGQGESLVDPTNYKPLYTSPKDTPDDPFVRLLKAAGIDPASPQGQKLLTERLTKEATHQPPISLNNYGSPLPIDLGNGQTGYIQPPSRPGGPTQILSNPATGAPAIKPSENKPKDLTEAQAKATAFLGQMRSASATLSKLGMDQSALSNQAETALAGGPMNAVIGAKAQQVRQSQDQWSEAFLRFKTGAASTKDEVIANRKMFFPVLGDKPENVAQKAAMRAQAERDMEIAAGRGAVQLGDQATTPQPATAASGGGFKIIKVTP